MQTRTLEVPGASLYYEVRGSGPVLLMIPGGPMDAAGFAPLADGLADRYTVVTCDCRGNSRSTAEGPKDDLTVGVFADDAHRLLAAVTSEPAYVLGSSGGASYGLDLVARYPEQVRTLVAHEPPVAALLPDAAHWRAFTEEIRDIYRRDGVFPAMQKFGEGVGLGGPEPGAEPGPEAMQRMMGNLELFAGYTIPVITNYQPDLGRAAGQPGPGGRGRRRRVDPRSARLPVRGRARRRTRDRAGGVPRCSRRLRQLPGTLRRPASRGSEPLLTCGPAEQGPAGPTCRDRGSEW